MYISKLNELCEHKSWSLPVYSHNKEGPDHNSFFTASVLVNGVAFSSVGKHLSSKLAFNDAAHIAFIHFNESQQSSSEGSSTTSLRSDSLLSYKSQLQIIAQKRNLTLPVYSSVMVGPPHNPRFKGKVLINENIFESPELCKTLKEADHAAAKVAMLSLPTNGFQEEVEGVALYRTLLRVLVEKEGFGLPKYFTDMSGEAHRPTFVSTVNINEEMFRGTKANAKKLAEDSAAKVAYITLTQRNKSLGPGVIPLKSQQLLPQSLENVIEEPLNGSIDLRLLYKSQLQFIAQKRNLSLPVYSSTMVGHPHNPRFKGKVTIDGKIFESPELCKTLKQADHAAAKVALLSFPTSLLQEEVEEVALYRNLLQEFAQKEGFGLAKYCTDMSGEVHRPTFVSTVKVNEEIFKGTEANAKKLAENSAAKVAYIALTRRKKCLGAHAPT